MAAKTLYLLRSRWRKLLYSTDAVAATEYAIMLVLIIVVAVGSISLIGQRFFNLYTLIANAVGNTI